MRLLVAMFAVLLAAGMSWSALSQAPGATISDCANCPTMVRIPAGKFTMGAGPDEENREGVPANLRGQAHPLRDIEIGAMWVGRTEITISQFRSFVVRTRHQSGAICRGYGADMRFGDQQGREWRDVGYPQTDAHPVACVSWLDAQSYVQWLSRTTGKRYRLLTEAEWEYAARAGTKAARPWGDGWTEACAYMNGADRTADSAIRWSNSEQFVFPCADRFAYTAPVASFPPNGFGLHDMLGNVAEWTADCWTHDLSTRAPDGKVVDPPDCKERGVRGGAWSDYRWLARSAQRNGFGQGYRSQAVGFRVARND